MNKKTFNIDNISFDIYSDNSVFGDGTHESTQYMLKFLQKYLIKDKSMMDIGTGTGILSVFAAKNGAKNILAIDISTPSLEWARKNFKRNNVNVEVEVNNLTEYIDEKFDIICANLPPAEQVENLKTVAKNLNKNGILIISWFNILKIENYSKDFKIVEHIEGAEYDGYVLTKINKEE